MPGVSDRQAHALAALAFLAAVIGHLLRRLLA
jgi:hypothetical protein